MKTTKTKFKPLSLVENKKNKEVEMVSFHFGNGHYEVLFICNGR